MPRGWRLLIDGEAPGPWNMGVDEALLESAVATGAATLRFYRWQGPWLSLGYGQTLAGERLAACRSAGIAVVRRVTGGRAVLHGGDLTYAVAAPEAALPAGLRPTYAILSAALADGLRAVGIEAETAHPPRRSPADAAFDCFSEPAGDELCIAGRKLVGSAQRRGRGGVLQHGSIRVRPDPAGLRAAAGLATGPATSLEELGHRGSLDELIAACVAAFEATLGVGLERVELPHAELRAAERRAAELSATCFESPSPHGEPQEHLSPADR